MNPQKELLWGLWVVGLPAAGRADVELAMGVRTIRISNYYRLIFPM